ncbi:putative protein-L-isoaspartate O-methyltransferase [Paratrimastix pyriformis]|uniref:protein-L-isoaspartate(D-aspartate) O-methyltransferase n=1 Tax=Paratrimastix pyriformis TaxID=342808 RepID=A0ABQ8U6B1_9EUKA|nr:putative protein-L-isoaspartate O-methyltransferase [Paratrimastix pyriformis]
MASCLCCCKRRKHRRDDENLRSAEHPDFLDGDEIPIHIEKWHGQDEMIAALDKRGLFLTLQAREAMLAVDRREFVRPSDVKHAYEDGGRPIGSNATISAPHIHAISLSVISETLAAGVRPGEDPRPAILDVGSGSGYMTACLAVLYPFQSIRSTLVITPRVDNLLQVHSPLNTTHPSLSQAGPHGRVLGVDHIPDLVDWSRGNIRKSHSDLLDQGRASLRVGDGFAGCPADGPFDAINVAAACEAPPEALLAQLKPGGVLCIPIGPLAGFQTLTRIQRCPEEPGSSGPRYRSTPLDLVRFVPLATRAAQESADLAMQSGEFRRATIGGERMVLKPFIMAAPDGPFVPPEWMRRKPAEVGELR